MKIIPHHLTLNARRTGRDMKPARFAASRLAATALAVIAGSAAIAQLTSTDPAAVQAGNYKVDSYHTQVNFAVSHFGFSTFSGQFGGGDGTLTLDPAHPSAAKLEVSIPTASVKTTVGKLDDELKGDQWLDSGKFPTATLTSTKINAGGKGSATVAGMLTLHGVTRPVRLAVRFVGAGINPLSKAYTVGFHATTTIDRSAFGVKTYVPLVGDTVTLTIDGSFEKQS